MVVRGTRVGSDPFAGAVCLGGHCRLARIFSSLGILVGPAGGRLGGSRPAERALGRTQAAAARSLHWRVGVCRPVGGRLGSAGERAACAASRCRSGGARSGGLGPVRPGMGRLSPAGPISRKTTLTRSWRRVCRLGIGCRSGSGLAFSALLVTALALPLLAWRVERAGVALLAHAAALAGSVALLSVGSRVLLTPKAVGRGASPRLWLWLFVFWFGAGVLLWMS